MHIYKKELDEIDPKLKINKSIKERSLELLLFVCIDCEYLLALLYLLLLFNPFFLFFLFQYPLKSLGNI